MFFFAGVSGTHNEYEWAIHQNIKLKLSAIKVTDNFGSKYNLRKFWK